MEQTSRLAPYEQAATLHRRRREAAKQGDRETAARLKRELVNLYVSHGEYFKTAEQSNPEEAKRCLQEALKLAPKHPIANYRYAHLMYRDRQYAEAVRHFNRALDGKTEPTLNESQTMIAHIFLVNCGVLMAKESFREVEYLQNNQHADLDKKLTGRYLDQMLLESEQMLQRFIYCRRAAGETTYISEAQFYEYRNQPLPNEAMICAAPEFREIRFGTSDPVPLDANAFYVLDTLLRAETPVQGKDLIDTLVASSLEIQISAEHMRQIFSRLHRKIPFWDDMIETDTAGKNKTTRKRKEGITYTLLHHASILTP